MHLVKTFDSSRFINCHLRQAERFPHLSISPPTESKDATAYLFHHRFRRPLCTSLSPNHWCIFLPAEASSQPTIGEAAPLPNQFSSLVDGDEISEPSYSSLVESDEIPEPSYEQCDGKEERSVGPGDPKPECRNSLKQASILSFMSVRSAKPKQKRNNPRPVGLRSLPRKRSKKDQEQFEKSRATMYKFMQRAESNQVAVAALAALSSAQTKSERICLEIHNLCDQLQVEFILTYMVRKYDVTG